MSSAVAIAEMRDNGAGQGRGWLALGLAATLPPVDAAAAGHSLAALTPRQGCVLGMVLAGQRSKTIAADLGLSQRTVENHRAAIMKKTGARSVPELVRIALGAA